MRDRVARHLMGERRLDEPAAPTSAVQQGKVGVAVQVDEGEAAMERSV